MSCLHLRNGLLALLFAVTPLIAGAAPMTPQQLNEAMTSRGGRVTLESDKAMLEPGESASLKLELFVPALSSEGSENAQQPPTEINLPDGSDPNLPAPYHPTNWRILEGGGTLTAGSSFLYGYKAPAQIPASHCAVISVDLEPTGRGLPKVVLVKTIYFVEDENAVVVNVPGAGIIDQKFVSTTNAGITAPVLQGLDPHISAHMTEDQKARYAQAMARQGAPATTGAFDTAGLTSNAMVIYGTEKDFSAFKFIKMALQLSGGRPATSTFPTVWEFGIKGRAAVGARSLTIEPGGVGITMMINGTPQVCFAGSNAISKTDKVLASGTVFITDASNGRVKGTIVTPIYANVGKKIFKGTLFGKFNVRAAN